MKFQVFTLALSIFFIAGCNKSSSTDIEETGQQIGDVMASIDESGGSAGTLAFNDRVFNRYSPATLWDKTYDSVVPRAYAAACASSSTFGSCSSTTEVKVVAAILERKTIEKILNHLGLPVDPPVIHPARPPPQRTFDDFNQSRDLDFMDS